MHRMVALLLLVPDTLFILFGAFPQWAMLLICLVITGYLKSDMYFILLNGITYMISPLFIYTRMFILFEDELSCGLESCDISVLRDLSEYAVIAAVRFIWGGFVIALMFAVKRFIERAR